MAKQRRRAHHRIRILTGDQIIWQRQFRYDPVEHAMQIARLAVYDPRFGARRIPVARQTWPTPEAVLGIEQPRIVVAPTIGSYLSLAASWFLFAALTTLALVTSTL